MEKIGLEKSFLRFFDVEKILKINTSLPLKIFKYKNNSKLFSRVKIDVEKSTFTIYFLKLGEKLILYSIYTIKKYSIIYILFFCK